MGYGHAICTVLGLSLGALAGPVSVAVSASPQVGAPVLVVGPPESGLWPGASAGSIATAAGGALIGPEMAPFAALAQFSNPGFAEELRLQGAWLVLDGAALAEICGVKIDETT